jgi:dimethylglycine dehydrogenase
MDFFFNRTYTKAQQRLVWPDEIHQLHPLLNMNKIKAGLYTPGDGHIDPNSLTMALATGARLYGAKIRVASPVVGTTQQADGSWVVETANDGTIRAERIINAAGLWARELGKLAGLDFPLVPIHHQVKIEHGLSLK